MAELGIVWQKGMTMPLSELPSQEITLEHVFDVIVRTEQRHRVVWTAGRILKEDGSLHRIATASPGRRRLVLRRIRNILKELVREGVLAERGVQFNYGTGTEASYDLVIHSHTEELRLPRLRP